MRQLSGGERKLPPSKVSIYWLLFAAACLLINLYAVGRAMMFSFIETSIVISPHNASDNEKDDIESSFKSFKKAYKLLAKK